MRGSGGGCSRDKSKVRCGVGLGNVGFEQSPIPCGWGFAARHIAKAIVHVLRNYCEQRVHCSPMPLRRPRCETSPADCAVDGWVVREDGWVLIHTAKVLGWTDDWRVSDREKAWLYATAAEQSHSAV